MSILSKVQKIRLEIQKANLKKSGKNKFANFDYYELEDILPTVLKLCDEQKVITLFNAANNRATLDIKDLENDEMVTFEVPFMTPSIPGANDVQNLGGSITYLRRYLLINAFEIMEKDPNDATIGKSTSEKQAEHPKGSNSTQKTSTSYNNMDASVFCYFGKNKGVKWSAMQKAQQIWYYEMFKNKESLDTDQNTAMEALKVLVGDIKYD